MLIPFLRKIPLLGMVMSLLIAGNSLAQPDFAPFPNFSPHGWAGVTVAADESGRMDVPLLFQYDYPETVITIDGEPRSVLTSGCGTTIRKTPPAPRRTRCFNTRWMRACMEAMGWAIRRFRTLPAFSICAPNGAAGANRAFCAGCAMAT